MTELIAPPRPSRAAFAGRVSQHRREQVASLGPQAVPHGPTGPVESDRRAADLAAVVDAWSAQVQERWLPAIKTLCRELESLTSVVLCTSAGAAVATYGLPGSGVSRASSLTGVLYGAGAALTETGLEAVHLSAGRTHTVVAPVPGTAMGDHVLAVTAEGVNPGPLLVHTQHAAVELRELLAAQP